MLFLIGLLSAACVDALRRLSLKPCDLDVFVLGQGAPTKLTGVTFGPGGKLDLMDARVPSSPKGAEILSKIPKCHAERARPIKIIGPEGIHRAVTWLETECRAKDCVVYTSIHGNADIASISVLEVRFV
jgi:hypothetical protein